MRQKDIFQKENVGGGFQGCPAVRIVTIILSILSLLAGIWIIACFGAITAWIAIAVVNVLTTGIPIAAGLGIAGVLLAKFRLRRRRRFWDW